MTPATGPHPFNNQALLVSPSREGLSAQLTQSQQPATDDTLVSAQLEDL